MLSFHTSCCSCWKDAVQTRNTENEKEKVLKSVTQIIFGEVQESIMEGALEILKSYRRSRKLRKL